MLCPKCKSWEVANGATDRFCAWCGASWLNVECEALQDTLYFSPRDREGLRFELELRNTGLIPLEIIGVATEPLGCALFPVFAETAEAAMSPRIHLAPGAKQKLAGRLQRATVQALLFPTRTSGNSRALPASFDAQNANAVTNVPIRFVLLLADDQRGPETTINVVPRPEFELLTSEVEVLEAGETSATLSARIPVRIRQRQGFATVQRITSSIPGITFVPSEKVDEHEGSENGVLDFQLDIARALVLHHLQSGEPLRTDLKLHCANSEAAFPPRNGSLQIIPRRTPRLSIMGARRQHAAQTMEIQTWALAGRARDYALQIKNENEHEISLHAIEATGTLECLKRKHLDLPLQLAPGATASLPFVIAAPSITNNAIITGTLALRYHAAGTQFTTECNLHLDVRIPKPFAGAAAIDFGAAQSCVAVASIADMPHARLLKIQNDPFVPTALAYQSMEANGTRNYMIGYDALSARSGKEAAPHVVQDFKQFLGSTQTRQIYLTREQKIVTLTYRDLIADYLHGLISAAEERLAAELFRQPREGTDFARCQLRNLVFVTPTTFTFKQKESLRELLAEMGITPENGLQFLPAPALSACAALETLAAQWQQDGQSEKHGSAERHVLVYEMGAGATEIALVRFMIKSEAEGAEFAAETKVLGCEGDEQFGGNNLTSALAKYLAEQALAQLKNNFAAKIVLPLWHRVGQAPQTRLEQAGYSNWKKLRRYAESLKCQFADLALPARVTIPRLALQILFDKTFQTSHVENLVLHSAMLEKVVATRMNLHVRRLQNLLRRANVQTPDRILLSGKSVALPGVRKILEAAFAASGCAVEYVGTSQTRRVDLPALHELKAAAVLGGVKFLSLRQNSFFTHAQQSMKTVMRLGLGINAEERMHFLPVIEKNIVIGRECSVPPFALTWESEVAIYATNKDDEPRIETEAELLGRFTLMQFKPALPADLEAGAIQHALQRGRLRMRLTPHRELQVLLRLRGREHAIYFELD